MEAVEDKAKGAPKVLHYERLAVAMSASIVNLGKKTTNAVGWFCPFFPLNNFFGILRLDSPHSAAIPNARRPK